MQQKDQENNPMNMQELKDDAKKEEKGNLKEVKQDQN